MIKHLTALLSLMILLVVFTTPAQAQAIRMDQRITQRVIIQGVQTEGSYVLAADNTMQTFACSNPLPVFSPSDSGQHGWACYDATIGIWLLNAQAPQGPIPVQPVVVSSQPAVVAQPAQVVPAQVVYVQPQPTVIYANPYPVQVYRSDRTVIVRDSIRTGGRIAVAAVSRRRR